MVGSSKCLLLILGVLSVLGCASTSGEQRGRMLATQKLIIQWGLDSISYSKKRHVEFDEHCESSVFVCEFGSSASGYCFNRSCGKIKADTTLFAQPTFWFDGDQSQPVRVAYCEGAKYYNIRKNQEFLDLEKEYGFLFQAELHYESSSRQGVLVLRDRKRQVSIRIEGMWVENAVGAHTGDAIPNKLMDGLPVRFCRE